MNEYLLLEQFVAILEHNRDNQRDNDIWLLHKDGSTSIVPDQNIAAFQDPQTWPKYICRSEAVNSHVSADGLYAALDHVNWAIGLTMSMANSRVARAASAFARVLTRQTGATT
ncbi:hypothetical protein RN2511_036070 [Rhodococcus sp. NKCM2511]|uniref:hypothetical protein n=1 Tax=Rhodococcus sp. NKCM2511 TaxID=2766011 RepID=UPI00190FC94E|nr:hypothetical protein [Rhodococcus sp. NKCM2511]GHP18871.1 hypothetical protein RN2511_036070 [Rhodococcus sp. NKCM2511]